MRFSLRVTTILACISIACQTMPAGGTTPDELATMFPTAQAPISTDRTLSLVTPSGELTLTSFRFAPKPGQSSHFNAMWCGLTVQAKDRASRAIVTIGRGDFETLSCDGLTQAGVMPAKGSMPRLGLIYRTRSPNFASTTALVLVDDPVESWIVDASVNNALNALTQTATLPLMRKALTQQASRCGTARQAAAFC